MAWRRPARRTIRFGRDRAPSRGRLGNILFRPLLRSHEIPYLGRSGAPLDRQIPVTDLVVSVAEGEIVLLLRSQQRQQEFVLYDFLSREYESRKARLASLGDPSAIDTA